MLDLNRLTTYDGLNIYLFDKFPYKDENEKSSVNSSFSKGTIWWYWINMCRENAGQDIQRDLLPKIREAIAKDF